MDHGRSIKEVREAYLKSVETLADHLSPYQRLFASCDGVIPLYDQAGDRWMVNAYATVQSAYNMEQDQWYCLTSKDPCLPHGDVVLGIILLLKYDLEQFYKKARKLGGEYAPTDVTGEIAFRFFNVNDQRCYSPEDCSDCDTNTTEEGYHINNRCDYHAGLFTGMEVGTSIHSSFEYTNRNIITTAGDHCFNAIQAGYAIKTEIGKNDSIMWLGQKRSEEEQERLVDLIYEILHEYEKELETK